MSDGEVPLTGLLFFQPQYGKLGDKKSLGRGSRRPLPRMIWSRVCWEMVRTKKPLVAIHVLMIVVTYCQLGELLQLMREDVIRTNAWCGKRLVTAPPPRSTRRASKTQSYDDAIDLRNQIYPWITTVAAVLAAGRPSERIFEYRYEDFTSKEICSTQLRSRKEKERKSIGC